MLAVRNTDNLIIKICLPVDRQIMAIAVKRDQSCREKLSTYLESDEATLQPNTLVEENAKPDGIKKWVETLKQMKDRINGIKVVEKEKNIIHEQLKQKNTNSNNQQNVIIHLPGSSKSIKVVASKYFDKLSPEQIKAIIQRKEIDLTNFRVEKINNKYRI